MATTFDVGERALWAGVVLAGVVAYYYVPYFLTHIKDSVAVPVPSPKTTQPQLQQDAEESIKPRTLAELASGPNYNLAASAIRLTATRFIRDKQAKRDLLEDLSSKQAPRRDIAINALRLLLTFPAVKDLNLKQHFVDYDTYSAIVTALINLLPEHEKHHKRETVHTSPIKPISRSAHEQGILEILLLLVEDQSHQWNFNDLHTEYAQPAINAGIITKWLSRYPFPCTLRENERFNFKRSDVARLLEKNVWGDDDPLMSRLVKILSKVPSGERQLVDVGLKASSILDTNISSREWATRSHPTLTFQEYQPVPEWPSPGGSPDEPSDENGQLIENEELLARLGGPRARNQSERTPGERSRQRRHRQAVVVAEPGVPLGPENILQRQPTETELAWQEIPTGHVLRRVNSGSLDVEEMVVDQLDLERIDGLGDPRGGFPLFQLPHPDAILTNGDTHSTTVAGQENIPPQENGS